MDIKDNTDLKKLNADDKLKYILSLQDKGLNRKQMAEAMGYTRLDTLDRFMKKYDYIKLNDRFVKDVADVEADAPVTNIIHEVVVEDKERTNNPTIVLQNQEMQNKLFDMLNNYDSFVEVIKWFNNSGSKSNRGQIEDNSPINQDTTIIEVNTGLQINYNKTQTKKTTIRLDEGIWEEFDKFSTDKYSQFSKQDLLSQALREFMDKY